MSEKPLLIFPEPITNARHTRTIIPSPPHFPSASRQVDRLNPQFAQLEKVFSSQNAELRLSAAGSEPEKVLVFETIGTVENFIKALKDIEGLEWLTEQNKDEIHPDDDFYRNEEDREVSLSGRLYLIMSNQTGLRQLLSFWDIFKSNPNAPQFQRGRTKWRELFKQLKDIHHWGPEDRLRETGLLENWRERVELGGKKINVEVELWYRDKQSKRNEAQSSVTKLVEEVKGKVLSFVTINEIGYHGMLVELPIQAVDTILHNPQTQLVQSDQIMFFKPVGQSVSITPKDEPITLPTPSKSSQKPTGEPIVALFDGLPMANHHRLVDRLIIDDPDGLAASYLVKDRTHGTAMASLIINGELNTKEATLTRPIYVRPILQPGTPDLQNQRREALPASILFIDLVHRAVRRLFEKEGSESPVAPKIKVINFSIGVCPFDHSISSLAKLIDYLAYKYRVLFIISAGNHADNIELNIPRNQFSVLKSNLQNLQSSVLKFITDGTRFKRLLSPSEAINGLTVGAVHEDFSPPSPLGNRINPYISPGLPSTINAHGPGFRRAIKPDILLPGGKQTYMEKLSSSHPKATLVLSQITNHPPGQQVATPSPNDGNLSAARYMCGTSNAAALATRTVALLYEKLLELKNEHGGDRLDDNYFAVLLKALLVHAASWGNTYSLISEILGKRDKETTARLIGYGQVQPMRVFSCTDQRATLLGFGELKDNQAHLYTIPIPPSLNAQRVKRRLTVTLAWLTPINTKHNAYRRAALWFTPYGINAQNGHFETLLKVNRQEADSNAVTRGTVQHEIFEGDRATSFGDNSPLQIQVNCRANAGDLREPIPYSLVFTFEVAENTNLPIYQEISTRIRPAIEIKT